MLAEIVLAGSIVYAPLTSDELKCAEQGQTYGEWCDQYGVTNPEVLDKANKLDDEAPGK